MDPKPAPAVDPQYAEKVVSKFLPHLDAIARNFETQARDKALAYFQTTHPDERAGIEAGVKGLLNRRDHYLQLKATVLNDPGIDRSALAGPPVSPFAGVAPAAA